LIEVGLFEEVVIDSYPTRKCRKKCLQKVKRKCVEYVDECVEENKDIYGLLPSEELLRACNSTSGVGTPYPPPILFFLTCFPLTVLETVLELVGSK